MITTGPSTGSGTGRREIPGRWFDRLTIRPDRPFDGLRDRSAGDSGPVVRQAHHPARPALRQAQGPAGGRFRAGGSTSSPSGPTGRFDKLRDRSAGDSGPVVRQAHHPARPALRQAQGPVGRLRGPVVRQAHHPARPVASTGSGTGQPFFCISDGVAPNSLAKQRVKYFGSLNPTS